MFAARALMLAAAGFLAAAPFCPADPPRVVNPPPAKVGDVIVFSVELAAGAKLGYQPAFDPADCSLYRLHADDEKTVLFLAQPRVAGKFGLALWTVGEAKGTTLVLTAGGTQPPPIGEPPTNPQPGGSLYLLVVRPDGPATPAFTRIMSDPAWDTLRGRKVLVTDWTARQAKEYGITDLAALPAVVRLRVSADGKKSSRLGAAVPLPSTPADILKLGEDVPNGTE